MGNTTTHTQYTTSNTSSAPHPSTPHDPNPTAPSNNSPTPNSSPPHAKPSPNLHAPNTPTPTPSPTATTDTSNATSPPTPPSSTCSALPSTPSPQTTPTPSPLMAPPSRAQVPTSHAPTGHPTPQTPPSPAGCAKPNASRGQAGLTTTPTPAVCPSVGCPPSHRTPATPTPPRAVPKSKAGLPVCSAYARGSARQGAPSSCFYASGMGGVIPKRWASWSCRTRSAACARAKTRAGATCRRVRLQVGGVGGCIATKCGRRKTSGSSARGGDGCRLWCGGVRCGCWCGWWVCVVGWGGASGWFLMQFLGGLFAVREPAGCVHACTKWQTPGVPPRSGGNHAPQRGRFFLARLAWRARRPRSQRRACWERERLARMTAEMPCSATPRAGTPAKNLPL